MMDWTESAERGWPEHLERRTYRTGWWWGFASGLICGGCSVGLLALLVWTIARALECPQC